MLHFVQAFFVVFVVGLVGLTHARSVYGDRYCETLYGVEPAGNNQPQGYSTLAQGITEPKYCDIYQCTGDIPSDDTRIHLRWTCGNNAPGQVWVQCGIQYKAALYYVDYKLLETPTVFDGSVGSVYIDIPATITTVPSLGSSWTMQSAQMYHVVFIPQAPALPQVLSDRFTILCSSSGYMTQFNVLPAGVRTFLSHNPTTFEFYGSNLNLKPKAYGGDIVHFQRLNTGASLPAFPCYTGMFENVEPEAISADLGPNDLDHQSFATWTWTDPVPGNYAVCYNIYNGNYLSSTINPDAATCLSGIQNIVYREDNDLNARYTANLAADLTVASEKTLATAAWNTVVNRERCNANAVPAAPNSNLCNVVITPLAPVEETVDGYIQTRFSYTVNVVTSGCSCGHCESVTSVIIEAPKFPNQFIAGTNQVTDSETNVVGVSFTVASPGTTTVSYVVYGQWEVTPRRVVVKTASLPAFVTMSTGIGAKKGYASTFYDDVSVESALVAQCAPSVLSALQAAANGPPSPAQALATSKYNMMRDMCDGTRFPDGYCNKIYQSESAAGRGEGNYLHLPGYISVVDDVTLTCSGAMFWGMETKIIYGNLMDLFNPDKYDIRLQIPLASQKSNPVPYAVTGCPSNGVLTFELLQTPTHHTGGGFQGSVPTTFTISSDGNFMYLNEPSKQNPVVWTGKDSFSYRAKCTYTVQQQQRQTYCDPAVVEITILPCQVDPCPKYNFGYTVPPTEAPDLQSMNSASLGPWMTSSGGQPLLYCKSGSTCSSSNWVINQEYTVGGTFLRTWDTDLNNVRGDGKNVDRVDVAWSENLLNIDVYGYVGRGGQRFGTFEQVQWAPGRRFTQNSVNSLVNPFSLSFDSSCLKNELIHTVTATDTVVSVATLYKLTNDELRAMNPGLPTLNTDLVNPTVFPTLKIQSWAQRYQGEYAACSDLYQLTSCNTRPLLTPNPSGRWTYTFDNCRSMARGVFDWNDLRTMTDKSGNKIWSLVQLPLTNEIALKGDFYSQAVQPNDLTGGEKRGWAFLDHKYTISITFSATTDFNFELGIDIFTVDLQQFRYYYVDESNSKQYEAFGFNMLIYPLIVSNAQWQQNPDRRVSNVFFYPNKASCENGDTQCAKWESPTSGHQVRLIRGPSTTESDCDNINNDQPYGLVYGDVPGLSPASPKNGACATNFQNVTFRGISNVEKNTVNPFGFLGTIIVQFELENGEHPNFYIKPKIFTKSLSITGAFEGSTSTCRTSPNWPVNPTAAWSIPASWNLCEEPDARTFGPHDWAVILFDIKDVDRALTFATKLSVMYTVAGVPQTVNFICRGGASCQVTQNVAYMNFHELSATEIATKIDTNPSAPHNMDFGFLFTPGAINENLKITIACTIRVLQTPNSRRFKALQGSGASDSVEGTINFDFNIDRRLTDSMRDTNLLASLKNGNAGSSSKAVASDSNSGSDKQQSYVVPMVVTGVLCASIIAAAIVGTILYVKRNTATLHKSTTSEMAITN
eukprot:PhF_6_TR37530/c1_g1_i1/m.55545